MAGFPRFPRGLLTIGVLSISMGCQRADEGKPNPDLGPPPTIKPERGRKDSPVPSPPDKSAAKPGPRK